MAQTDATSKIPRRTHDVPPPALKGFGAIKGQFNVGWPLVSDKVVIPSDLLRLLFRLAAENVPIDQHYYLSAYPDVVQALEEGLFASARHHYVEFGYLEDRLPFRVEVDDAFYFWAYPDVKAGVSAGTIPSAQEHFELCGYKEGREPREGWSLLAS